MPSLEFLRTAHPRRTRRWCDAKSRRSLALRTLRLLLLTVPRQGRIRVSRVPPADGCSEAFLSTTFRGTTPDRRSASLRGRAEINTRRVRGDHSQPRPRTVGTCVRGAGGGKWTTCATNSRSRLARSARVAAADRLGHRDPRGDWDMGPYWDHGLRHDRLGRSSLKRETPALAGASPCA